MGGVCALCNLRACMKSGVGADRSSRLPTLPEGRRLTAYPRNHDKPVTLLTVSRDFRFPFIRSIGASQHSVNTSARPTPLELVLNAGLTAGASLLAPATAPLRFSAPCSAPHRSAAPSAVGTVELAFGAAPNAAHDGAQQTTDSRFTQQLGLPVAAVAEPLTKIG